MKRTPLGRPLGPPGARLAGLGLGAAACLGAAILSTPRGCLGAERPRGLRLTYETRGVFPGSDDNAAERRSRQVITVDPTGQRLLLLDSDEVPSRSLEGAGVPREDPGADPKAGPEAEAKEGAPKREWALRRKLILRMDLSPPIIYELLPGEKEYREHSGDLNDLQKDRRITEENERKLVGGYPAADREAYYKRYWWLRPDGSRQVKVTREQGERVLGRDCEHLRVLENGREIIDAQIAREQVGASSYYQLYRRLGAFSEEVLEKIRDVEGFPLKGRITIVTALPTRTIEFEATGVDIVDVDPASFELPPGAVKVDEVPDHVVCGECGKEIEGGAEESSAKIRELDGHWTYFCSEECAEKYVRRRIPEKLGGKK